MIEGLRAMLMGLGRALGGAARRPLVTVLATGAVGVSLLLVGLVVLAAQNVSRLTQPWGQGVQMVVYLSDGTTPERARAIADILRSVEAITRVDYVPPDAALARLEQSLGERRDLLDGVEIGYLPASLEVTLAAGVREVAEASPLVARLRATPGVEEVELLGDWVDKVTALIRTLRLAAAALALVVALACVYVVAGTIKLGMYARKDEIEVLKLVGATDRFVKGPLVVEGALQGALGAGVALGLLFAVYRLGAPALEQALGGAVGPLELSFLPVTHAALVLAAGALLGVVGSWVAMGSTPMRSAGLAVALLLSFVAFAAAGPTRSELPRAERELAAAERTRALVADKLSAREAELAHRVRVLYKLTRAGHAPLWTDERARTDLTRRRAAARRLILRDLEERQLLRDELDRAGTQAARLERDVAALAAATPPPLPEHSLMPPVGGRRTGAYGGAIDAATHARLSSRGVSWATVDGAVVTSPTAGMVLYVGRLRGLGQIVLVDIGDGLSLLVSGIGTLAPGLVAGSPVAGGARLGVAHRGIVGLELRRDGRTVDPTPFLSNPR